MNRTFDYSTITAIPKRETCKFPEFFADFFLFFDKSCYNYLHRAFRRVDMADAWYRASLHNLRIPRSLQQRLRRDD